MLSQLTNHTFTKLGIIATIFFLALVTNIAYSQTPWAEPPAPPTAGNTSAPINEGSATQVKTGSFGVTRTLTAKYLDAQPQVDGAGNEYAGEGGELLLRGQGGWNHMVVDNYQGRFRVWETLTNREALVVYPDTLATWAIGGLRAHDIVLGACGWASACPFPHETLSMNSGHNLRILFGNTEQFVFGNNGWLYNNGGVTTPQSRADAFCDRAGNNCVTAAQMKAAVSAPPAPPAPVCTSRTVYNGCNFCSSGTGTGYRNCDTSSNNTIFAPMYCTITTCS